MKCDKPIIVFDLNNRIPSHGENRLELELKEDNLFISVFFEDDNKKENELTFCFEHSVYHSFQSMPGVKMNNSNYSLNLIFSKLVEFQFSEAANLWIKHFKNLFTFKHFCIYFENENKLLEVVSKNFKFIDSKK